MDCGQLLNGTHTTDSKTDWQEFDRAKDPRCLKACMLHTGLSFVETCMQAGIVSGDGGAYFGRIKTFVSYTWRSDPDGPKTITFANLLEAIENALEQPGDTFFFIDVFCVAQHRAVRPGSNTCANETDVKKFKEVIGSCENLVLYCTPIAQPKTLTRVWCLYEIMQAVQRGIPILVALSAVDREDLRDKVLSDYDQIVHLFMTIRSENATATFENDKFMVFGWITEQLGPNGFKDLDQIVAEGMRPWLARTGLTFCEEIDGSQDDESAKLKQSVGNMLRGMGRYREALPLLQSALQIYEAVHGPDHSSVANTLNNLAALLDTMGDYAEAKPMYERALQIDEAVHGPDHSDVARTLNN
jgi:tetratricopeptide (TPR) repeat protein